MTPNASILWPAAGSPALENHSALPPPAAVPPPEPTQDTIVYPSLNQLDQYEKIIGVRNNVSDGALLTALWVDVVIGTVLVLVFVLVHTRNKIYRIRLGLQSISVRPPPLPTKGLVTLYLWFKQVVCTSDLDLLATAGLDALVLSKVVGLGIKMFLPFALVGLLLLVPIHQSGNGLAHFNEVKANSTEGQRPLMTYTAANITNGNPVFWVHFVLVYLFTFYAMFLLRWQYYNYVKLREHYMVAGNDVNYWRQVLAHENPDQAFEYGKYVGALQLVRKLTRSKSDALEDATPGSTDPSHTALSVQGGGPSGSHGPGDRPSNLLVSVAASLASGWRTILQRNNTLPSHGHGTGHSHGSRAHLPREDGSSDGPSEEDDNPFLQPSHLTSSMSNIAQLAAAAAAGFGAGGGVGEQEGAAPLTDGEVVVEVPSPLNASKKSLDGNARVNPTWLPPLDLSSPRDNSVSSAWHTSLPSLPHVMSPHLGPTSPTEVQSLPPLPPPWHLRGSGPPMSTFNHSSLTPVIHEMKVRSSHIGPLENPSLAPSMAVTNAANTPTVSRLPSIQQPSRQGSGAWGLVGPNGLAEHPMRRTTGESSMEEDAEAYLLRKGSTPTAVKQLLGGSKKKCTHSATAKGFNWAWWDKVALDTEVKQELSKGRHLLSKPSVRYRTTVNTIERSGRVVAVNASQYTVLVTDVDEAPFPERQRVADADAMIRWISSTLPVWLSLPLLRYVFLMDVQAADLTSTSSLEAAVARRRSLTPAMDSSHSLASKLSRAALSAAASSSRRDGFVREPLRDPYSRDPLVRDRADLSVQLSALGSGGAGSNPSSNPPTSRGTAALLPAHRSSLMTAPPGGAVASSVHGLVLPPGGVSAGLVSPRGGLATPSPRDRDTWGGMVSPRTNLAAAAVYTGGGGASTPPGLPPGSAASTPPLSSRTASGRERLYSQPLTSPRDAMLASGGTAASVSLEFKSPQPLPRALEGGFNLGGSLSPSLSSRGMQPPEEPDTPRGMPTHKTASLWEGVPTNFTDLQAALARPSGSGQGAEVLADSPAWQPTLDPNFSTPKHHREPTFGSLRTSGLFGPAARSSAPAHISSRASSAASPRSTAATTATHPLASPLSQQRSATAMRHWQLLREAVLDGRAFKIREDVVTRTFRRLFPDEFDRAIPVFRHDELDRLLLQWDWHQAQLEKAIAQKDLSSDPTWEPMERVCGDDCSPGCWSPFCCLARRVKSIPYHQAKVLEYEKKIMEERRAAQSDKYTPSWFVFFKTQKAATLAAHALLHPEDNCKFQVHPAPGPENINWEALWFGYWRLKLRRLMVLPLLLLVVIMPISIFSGALSELDALLCGRNTNGPILWEWYCQDQDSAWVFRRVLTGWLPSLLLNLYQNMVIPRVMYYIAQRESYSYSLSGLDARVLEIYFFWDFFNVFLGGVLGQLIIRHVRGLFEAPGNLFSILGVNLPYASNFFFSYIWFRGLVIIPFRLLIPHPGLFCWLFKLGGRCGCAMTERQKVELYETRSVRHGVELGIVMLAYLVGLAYCVSSPLLAACTLIYFLIAWVFWRYILLYVFVRKYESGGSLWPWVFNRICCCLVVFQFFTACVLMVKQAYFQGSIIMFTLPLMTVHFARQCNQSFAKGVRSTPLELAHEAPVARIHPTVYIPPPMQPSLVGWYPEWMKAWEGWGAVAYTT